MKNIVITGGTSGVGLAIAKDLVASDAQVIVVGRNKNKAEQAVQQLGARASYLLGDLSNETDRERIISEIKAQFPHIDVLINSAGIMPATAQDNIDTNLIPHYALTTALADELAGGRVLIATGNPQAIKRIPICERQGNQLERAAWLVTHKTLLTALLAEQLAPVGITVNSFFPGDVRSDLMDYTRTLSNTEVPVGKYLALSPEVTGITNTFFDDHANVVPLNGDKYSAAKAKKVLAQYLPI